MITYIKINGFKSFHNFEMEFTPLTVIAGVNASGKSNLFDALSLLSRLAETDLKTAFNEQRGNPRELFTLYGEEHASEMEFVVELLLNKHVKDKWGQKAELIDLRLRYEVKIKLSKNDLGIDDLFLDTEQLILLPNKKRKKHPSYISTEEDAQFPWITIKDGKNEKVFPSSGASQTVLSNINSVDFPHVFAVKQEMINWKFLQLNPKDLREPTQIQPGLQDIITPSGKNLAAALYRIYQTDSFNLVEISRRLNSFIPHFVEVKIKNDQANQQFLISLIDENGKEFSSRLLSEGTLRLLALCILEFDDKHTGLICFEEPENGIHPFRIKAMAALLRDLSTDFSSPDMPLRQMIVNTHSPTLLGELVKWKEDKTISVGLSFLKKVITDIDKKRLIMRTTHIEFASSNPKESSLKEEENRRKFTIAEIKRYLETTDTKNAIKLLYD